LLVVKYFCATTRKIVTLGCHYIPQSDPLTAMVTSGWVSDRLQPFVNSKEVAPLPENVQSLTSEQCGNVWECWEEFSERDIQPRQVKRTVKNEQLWTGDVIVWQLAGPASHTATGEGEAPSSPVAADAPTDAGVEADGEMAPNYPVHTVADLAAHIANTADVVVTLHDSRQPLCVDGVVSNGHWGPPRPASAAPSPTGGTKKAEGGAAAPPSPAGTTTREERPEDQALALSPAEFNQPQERELKMDLRWHLHHVTSTVARAFGLPSPARSQIWLFHAAPGSSCEEPLNDRPVRSEQTTLKELHRSCSYLASAQGGRRPAPLALHAVQLPYPLGAEAQPAPGSQGTSICHLCLRFFDAAVREVGSKIITLPAERTIENVIVEAQRNLAWEWGISGPLRVLEVSEGRLHRHYRSDAPLRSLALFSRSNIFYHCLRVEADPDSNLPDGHTLLEIYHCDRQSQQAFGQPILLAVAPGEKSGSIKNRCKTKLQVPDMEFKSWRLVRCARSVRTHLKDDEAWDSETATDAKLCLEHVHPNPTSNSRQSRYNKPLTIKA
jgi:hypothetical protein